VTVVHEGTVGPYETVTLHANQQGALTGWLTDNGYAIDADVQPIIDAYSAEGFDFIALRLLPNQGVQQMRPVRVVMQGAVPTLPLRMVAAGTGANVAITLFVVGEGRWETENFPNAVVNPSDIVWDFSVSRSDYAELRQAVLETNKCRTWLTPYSKLGTLLKPAAITSPLGGTVPVEYMLSDGSFAHTIAAAYFQQGIINGEAGNVLPFDCTDKSESYADSGDQVVDLCAPVGGGSGTGGSGAGSGGAGGAGVGGSGLYGCGWLGHGGHGRLGRGLRAARGGPDRLE
jgi:hypothetical protein